MRIWTECAENYYGQLVNISPITKDPKLSLWAREGLPLPASVQQFYEQANQGEVVTMFRWTPTVKPKSKDEVDTK